MSVIDLSRADPRTLIGKGRVGLLTRPAAMTSIAMPGLTSSGNASSRPTGWARRCRSAPTSTTGLRTASPTASARCSPRSSVSSLPYFKAPRAVIPIYDWSGFYVGINGGGGSAQQCWDVVNAGGVVVAPPVGMGRHHATGGTVGGHIGYRWQIANSVFGLETQGNWADFKGSNANLAFAGVRDDSTLDAFGLFTGQCLE